MKTLLGHAVAIGTCCLLLTSQTALARQSAQQERTQKTAELPICAKKLGTIAVLEADDNWWSAYELASPTALIKVFVNKSKCFTLLDRGKGMNALQGERELASSGELRNQSNLGKGQMKAADYALIPDLISRNSDSGGTNIGGLIGGLVGGRAGGMLGGLNLRSKTADVVLTVTDIRSSEQVALAEGHAKKTDIGFGGGGALFGGSLAGAAGVSSYANTEIGQVMTLAYLQAYTDLIAQLGGLPDSASAASPKQAFTVNKPGRLLKQSNGKGGSVRDLDPGMLLYPTGTKDGLMFEVEDELGNRGWVNSSTIELAR